MPSIAASSPPSGEDTTSFWQALEAELAQWQAAGETAGFWWRDDDAVAASPELDRLTRCSTDAGAPMGIAAVPKHLEPSLAEALGPHPRIQLLQHGFAHVDHARQKGQGAWELGLHRPVKQILSELGLGRRMMASAFGEQFLPVVTPPWNRFDRRLMPGLSEAGFIGISAAGERPPEPAVSGFVEANIHYDLLSWKAGGRFRGEASATSEIVGHLRRRRLGTVDRDEPTGILTHHLVLDESAWRFLAELLGFVARHPAARWLAPREIFSAAPPRQVAESRTQSSPA
jgi:hypothetical protein